MCHSDQARAQKADDVVLGRNDRAWRLALRLVLRVARFNHIAAELVGEVRHFVEEFVIGALVKAPNFDPTGRRDESPGIVRIDPVEDLAGKAEPGELSDSQVPAFGTIEYQLALHLLFHGLISLLQKSW